MSSLSVILRGSLLTISALILALKPEFSLALVLALALALEIQVGGLLCILEREETEKGS